MKKIDFYELNYELSMQRASADKRPVIDRQVEVLEKLVGEKFAKNGVKQIVSCKMRDIFIVYEDGKVLKNFQSYESRGVEGIFNAGRNFYYVIYKDNTVDALYDENGAVLKGKYDKILFNENFLLLLKKNELVVLSWVWSGIEDVNEEMSVIAVYDGVSDVQLSYSDPAPGDEMMDTDIKIKVGGEWLTMRGAPMMHSKGKCDCAHCESKTEK